jgi:nucleoside 2-deoxyribosyltransferase
MRISDIYIAGKFEDQAFLKEVAAALGEYDYFITSRWLSEEGAYAEGDAKSREVAMRDLDDIDEADVIVCFPNPLAEQHNGTTGRHFEAGYTYAQGKPLIFVGQPNHPFYALPGVTTLNPDWTSVSVAQIAEAIHFVIQREDLR